MNYKINKLLIIIICLILVFFLLLVYTLYAISKNNIPAIGSGLSAKVESQIFLKPIEDNFPQNTLEIPRDKWSEKNEALALRALKYFQANDLGTMPLPKKDVEDYKNFLMSWGKPWRSHFLKTELSRNELRLVWENQLLIQANDPDSLLFVEKTIQEKLSRVNPPVEVDFANFKSYYANQGDINVAIKKRKLVKVDLKNIGMGEDLYVSKEFAVSLESVDFALKDFSGVFLVTSATRSLDMQTLLRKLGYPAAKASYHNLGLAIDFKLSKNAAEEFAGFLKSERSNSNETGFDYLTRLYYGGNSPVFDCMINSGTVPTYNKVAKAYLKLREATFDNDVQIFDETPFFIDISKDGKLIAVNPTFHLQMEPF